MKKLMVLVLLLFICTILYACGTGYRVDVEGVHNFDKEEGYVEINVHLLPSDHFLEHYPYTSAQYNHKEIFRNRLSIVATECSIVIVNYNAEQYALAKEFCLQNMELVNSFEYNGYMFAENVMLAKARGELRDDNTISIPHIFNMFAYHDEKQCLIFVGACILDSKKMIGHIEENTKKDPDAWGEFWQEHFAEFYPLA